MAQLINGIIPLAIGLLLLVGHEAFTRYSLRERNPWLGTGFAESDVPRTKPIAILVGIGFVIFGVISLLVILPIRGG